jgi:predicted MFS family arabinose efflux permease
MTSGKRACIGIAAIAIGWTLMVVAYDKPGWFFQMAGVIGVLLVLAAIFWWVLSARRAKGAPSLAPDEARRE